MKPQEARPSLLTPDDLQTLIVYNVPAGGLQIIKSDEDTGERLGGVARDSQNQW